MLLLPQGNYKDETFTLNVAAELHWMDSSNCHASRFLPRGIPHLDEIRELYCSAQSNIAGWSNYPVFLKNWLKHFPREQLLVLYTEQFDREPGMVLRAIHEFLGLQQYRYPDETMQQTHFNTQSCGYGWRDGCAEEQPEAVPSQGGGSDSDRSTNHPQNMQKFYDDAVRGVVDLARVGQVSMPPLSWFGNGRLERLNMTRYDYFKIHKDHIRNLPAATKQSKAIRELGKQSSKV